MDTFLKLAGIALVLFAFFGGIVLIGIVSRKK